MPRIFQYNRNRACESMYASRDEIEHPASAAPINTRPSAKHSPNRKSYKVINRLASGSGNAQAQGYKVIMTRWTSKI